MIRFLKHGEIDKEQWDKCIHEAFNGLIYAYSWYLDTVSEDWEALVEGNYERVFPLTHRKKFLINYLYQPFFTQQLGVFSKSLLTSQITGSFIEAIPAKYKFAEINLNSHNKLDLSNRQLVPLLNHELDLIDTYENIAGRYSQNIKRNIKKAKSSGVTIVNNIRPDDIIDLFISNKGKTIQTLNETDYQMFKRLVYTSMYKGKARVVGAYTEENELCAGAIFLVSHHRATFIFSATNQIARGNGAMSLLIDTFIYENSGSRLTFDFEGSNDPALAHFYKSFGSKEVYYHMLRFNKLPWPVNIGVKLIKANDTGPAS